MAAITRGEGGDEAMVRGWLTKALTASRGPQWVCDTCGTVHAAWGPVCTNCHGFDTLSWKTPPAAEFTLPGGVEMLPLLVGRPGEATAETAGENLPVRAD
jgi:HemY protein